MYFCTCLEEKAGLLLLHVNLKLVLLVTPNITIIDDINYYVIGIWFVRQFEINFYIIDTFQ